MSFHLIGTNGFHVEVENGRVFCCGSRCRPNLKFENFKAYYVQKLHKKRAARAARLFYLIQPIKSLIFAVSRTPEICIFNEKKQEFCTLFTPPMCVFYFDDISYHY